MADGDANSPLTSPADAPPPPDTVASGYGQTSLVRLAVMAGVITFLAVLASAYISTDILRGNRTDLNNDIFDIDADMRRRATQLAQIIGNSGTPPPRSYMSIVRSMATVDARLAAAGSITSTNFSNYQSALLRDDLDELDRRADRMEDRIQSDLSSFRAEVITDIRSDIQPLIQINIAFVASIVAGALILALAKGLDWYMRHKDSG